MTDLFTTPHSPVAANTEASDPSQAYTTCDDQDSLLTALQRHYGAFHYSWRTPEGKILPPHLREFQAIPQHHARALNLIADEGSVSLSWAGADAAYLCDALEIDSIGNVKAMVRELQALGYVCISYDHAAHAQVMSMTERGWEVLDAQDEGDVA